jgi:hypothetical protein
MGALGFVNTLPSDHKSVTPESQSRLLTAINKPPIRLIECATRNPARVLALFEVAKTPMGLLIESARTSMLPCDPEKMDSGRIGDEWTKK